MRKQKQKLEFVRFNICELNQVQKSQFVGGNNSENTTVPTITIFNSTNIGYTIRTTNLTTVNTNINTIKEYIDRSV